MKHFFSLLLMSILSFVDGNDHTLNNIPELILGLGMLDESPETQDISNTCINHVRAYREVLRNVTESIYQPDDRWAFKMLDAHSRFPDGILEGNFLYPIGAYSSCMELKADSMPEPFRGRFFNFIVLHLTSNLSLPVSAEEIRLIMDPRHGFISLPPMPSDPREQPVNVQFRLSLCVPSSCSPVETTLLLNLRLAAFDTDLMKWRAIPLNDDTRAEDYHIEVIDIVMISVLVFFGAMATLGLGVDLFWTKERARGSLLREFLLGFSPFTNTGKLLNTSSPASTSTTTDHLACLNGIRFLSMTWVLLSHTITSFRLGIPIINLIRINEFFGNFWSQALLNGYVSVDSFFFLGGCLLAYMTFKELDRVKGKFNVLMFYIHRYIRLTGVYAIIILFHTSLLKLFTHGPNDTFAAKVEWCKDSYWKNLIYINNFSDRTCIGQAWYLATEMQMFVVSPLILYPMWLIKNKVSEKKESLAYAWLGLWTLTSVVTTMILTAVKGWGAAPALDDSETYHDENYRMPWTRIQPYLAGIGLGYLLHAQKGKHIKINYVYVLSAWMLATATAMAVLYGADVPGAVVTNVSEHTSEAKNVVYGGLHRLAWGLSLAWMVWACIKGYGGFVNRFLSWEAFTPLARLSYVMYLIHEIVIGVFTAFVTYPTAYSHLWAVIGILWVLMWTIIASMPIVILFEMPLYQCEKFLFGSLLSIGKKSKTAKKS